MNYTSTRDSTVSKGAADAIAQGISSEGGLFVPQSLPSISLERLEKFCSIDYISRAIEILSEFLTDFSLEEITDSVTAAYGAGRFEDPAIAPVVKLSPETYMLELWHGPTCAFKDMALQLLPHLLIKSVGKLDSPKEVIILVATSGDTGKAALEGFKDVAGTRILVFYPEQGVSHIQKLQMQTQEGDNVGVCAVYGNFDDTQTGVKNIFTNQEIISKLAAKNMMFSSANSINWGRLVPQIVYYFSGYCDMVNAGEIKLGEKINVCVPTGNFGNILAAYYAKKMGLPLGKLICASNKNNVLTDFINTGVYDRRRDFYPTTSPSMDIVISSNLERLLYLLSQKDDKAVAQMMKELSENGIYNISDSIKTELQQDFYGGFCSEEDTISTIRNTFDSYNYLCDTHTAVGAFVHQEYVKKTSDNTKTLVVSTANPYKFAGSILAAFSKEDITNQDEFKQALELSKITKTKIPKQILELANKKVRFTKICDTKDMLSAVEEISKGM